MTTKVQVRFESFHPSLIGVLPENSIMLPIELSPSTLREALTALIPQASFDSFDFVIDGQLLGSTLELFLKANNWSNENLLTILLIPHIVQPSKVTAELSTNEDWVSTVISLSPSSSNIAFGSFSGMLSFTSISNDIFEKPKSILLDECFPIKSLLKTSSFLLASHGRKTSVVDINRRKILNVFAGHSDTIESSTLVDSSSDHVIYATGSYDKSIRINHLFDDNIETKSILTGHSGAITGLAKVDQENKLIAASLDGSSRIWDLENSQVISTFPNGIPLLGLAVSPVDTNLVAAPLADMSIRVWDIRQKPTSASFRSLKGHRQLPTSAIFSTNCPTSLYSVGQDNLIKSWDLRISGKRTSDVSISTFQSSLSNRLLTVAQCPLERSLIIGGDCGLESIQLTI